jgi:hypothetical protein
MRLKVELDPHEDCHGGSKRMTAKNQSVPWIVFEALGNSSHGLFMLQQVERSLGRALVCHAATEWN